MSISFSNSSCGDPLADIEVLNGKYDSFNRERIVSVGLDESQKCFDVERTDPRIKDDVDPAILGDISKIAGTLSEFKWC